MKKDGASGEDPCQEPKNKISTTGDHGNKRILEATDDSMDDVIRNWRAPVDHGWAWIVVLGCFGVFAVAVGILKSFGVLLVELSRRYEAPASLLSSSQSLCSYLHMSIGTVSNALSVRYGHRRVVFIGGVLAAIGLISTAFVTSIEWFFVTYGLITGVGLGMCLSPSLVFFGRFFKRHLALANGLASAGSGFGSFVFPYLMLYLLDEYSIEGCMLILGGITFNICVFAALFRPLSFWSKKVLRKSSNKVFKRTCGNKTGFYYNSAEKELFINGESNSKLNLSEKSNISSSLPCMNRDFVPVRKRASSFSLGSERKQLNSDTHVPTAMLYASMHSLPAFSTSPLSKSSLKKIDDSANDKNIQDKGKAVCKLVNWALLKNPTFHMIIWGSFCAIYGHHSLFNVIPSLAVEFGFSDSQGTIAVSIVGICDLIGRIGTGVVSNNISWKKISVYRLSLAVFAVTNLILAFADSFVIFVVLCALLGITTGGYIGIQMAVFIESLGLENLSSAWGYAAFFVSISLLVNPVIAGVTKDATNTWTTSIELSSAVCFLGVLTWSSEYIINVINKILNSLKQR